MTLEEFEDKLVTSIDKIHNQHVYQLIKPAMLVHIEQQVCSLLLEFGEYFGCKVSDKVIVKVKGSDHGRITIEFLNPNDPIYEIRYDGTRGKVIDYRKYYESKDLYKAFIGFPYDSLYTSHE